MELSYRYALDENNNLVNVQDLDRQNLKWGKVFYCIGCNTHLIPKLGKIKVKHFAHKHIEITCKYETYLHKLAKKIFYKEYKKCLENNIPFYITVLENSICNFYEKIYDYSCNIAKSKTHNLTKYFDLINVEKAYSNFIPDILLQSSKSNKSLFIEFAVSHKCDEKKLNSNNKIIEFSVKSDFDLDNIINHHISYSDYNASFFNFKQLYDYSCNGYCKEKISIFVLNINGKSRITETCPNNLDKFTNKDVIFHEVLGKLNENVEIGEVYISIILKAFYIKHLPVKNCYLCKYHSFSPIKGQPIFCRVSKQFYNSNTAAECTVFNPIKNISQCKDLHIINEKNKIKYLDYMLRLYYSY